MIVASREHRAAAAATMEVVDPAQKNHLPRDAPSAQIQSLVTLVPAADPFVARLRAGGDQWARRGVPAHITVAGHWPLSLQLPLESLERIADGISGTSLTFDRVGLLGDTVCLLLTEDSPIMTARRDILKAVGVPDAKDSGWRPHLTITRTAARATLAEARARLAPILPLRAVLDGLAIVQAPDEGRVTIVRL